MMWLTVPAWGADASGSFAMGGAVGSVKCPQFVAVMEKARSVGIDSPGSMHVTWDYMNYIFGFETGYNAAKPDTFDIFPDATDGPYPLFAWIENYCRSNTKSNFADGVVALAEELYLKRQRHSGLRK
jgi:hypothetical protein